MNICVDIDGTITNAYYWIEYINKHFGCELKEEDMIYYDICKVLDITHETFMEFYTKCSYELHKNAVMRDSAKEILSKFAENHNIYYVTARPEELRDVTLEWFEEAGLPKGDLFMLGSHDKVQKAKELDCELFFEDRYENAIQLSEAGIRVLLLDCYYNRQPLNDNITRVMDWMEIYNIVKEIEESAA